jgi:hypothetical protein
VHARCHDHIAAITTGVDAGAQPSGAVAKLDPGRIGEYQMQAITAGFLEERARAAMLDGQGPPTLPAVRPIQVDHEPAGRRPGRNGDVRLRPAAPPLPDVLTVAVGVFEAMAGKWFLAAAGEHRQAQLGVVQGGFAALAHADRPRLASAMSHDHIARPPHHCPPAGERRSLRH